MTKVKIEIPFSGYTLGQLVDVDVDENGTPKTRFWRRCFTDSKIDGCISIVKKEKKSMKKFEEK